MMCLSNARKFSSRFPQSGAPVRFQPESSRSRHPQAGKAGKSIFSLQRWQFSRLAGVLTPYWQAFFLALQPAFHFSLRTPLVIKSGAFYNPSNTALEAKVAFMCDLGAQPPKNNGCIFRERVLEY
jgi:hypothetical protein